MPGLVSYPRRSRGRGVGGGGSGFVPPNLGVWYTPDGPTPPIIVGSGVDNWPVRPESPVASAVGDLRQNTDGFRPTIAVADINGLDAVVFDNVDDSLFSGAFLEVPQPFSFASIMKLDIIQSNDRIFRLGGDNVRSNLLTVAGPVWAYQFGTQRTLVGSVPDLNYHYFIGGIDGANSFLEIDGVNFVASGDVGTNGATVIELGFSIAAAGVRVAEFVVMNGVPAGNDLTNLRAYLKARSGL